jgi:hypothetical protein
MGRSGGWISTHYLKSSGGGAVIKAASRHTIVLLRGGPNVYYSFDFRGFFRPIENPEPEVRHGRQRIIVL